MNLDPVMLQVGGAAIYGLLCFGLGFTVSKYGVSGDIAFIKTELSNLKNLFHAQTQAPVVPPVVVPVTNHTAVPATVS